MAEKISHSMELQEDMIRVLMADGKSVMHIAQELDLTPREVRNILQETLMLLDNSQHTTEDRIPIEARPPADLLRIASEGLRSLLERNGKRE